VKKLLKGENVKGKICNLCLHYWRMVFIITDIGYSNTQKKKRRNGAAASNQTEYFKQFTKFF